MATRRPLVNITGTVHEFPTGDVPYPFTQTMLDFLSHCSVSVDGQPLWNGLPWGSEPSDGIGSMVVGSTFIVG